jgi:hypothetical protein
LVTSNCHGSITPKHVGSVAAWDSLIPRPRRGPHCEVILTRTPHTAHLIASSMSRSTGVDPITQACAVVGSIACTGAPGVPGTRLCVALACCPPHTPNTRALPSIRPTHVAYHPYGQHTCPIIHTPNTRALPSMRPRHVHYHPYAQHTCPIIHAPNTRALPSIRPTHVPYHPYAQNTCPIIHTSNTRALSSIRRTHVPYHPYAQHTCPTIHTPNTRALSSIRPTHVPYHPYVQHTCPIIHTQAPWPVHHTSSVHHTL